MSVQVVEKAFSLLEYLAEQETPVTLAGIAAAAGLPKPTAVRILATLQHLGYVSRPAGGRNYTIGPRVSILAKSDSLQPLKVAAKPLLESLNKSFNETVNLGILAGQRVVYVDFVETTRPLRMIVAPGTRDPWYSTALGKAIASAMDSKDFDRLLARTELQRLTSKTIRSKSALRQAVSEVQRTGVAEEIGESVEGVACAAISLASLGFPNAAVSIAVPLERFAAGRRRDIINILKSQLH